MHLVCCQKFVFGVHSLQPLISPVPGSHAIACTKKCYFKVAKNQNMTSSTRTVPTHLAVSNNTVPTHLAIPDNTRLPWNTDGQNGPQDPNHSEAILIDWLTTPGNYEKYRGSGNGGRRKIHFATMISSKIKDAGVRKPRTPKDVQNKIEYVEKCFRSAHDWAHTETGEGLRESDTGTYEEASVRGISTSSKFSRTVQMLVPFIQRTTCFNRAHLLMMTMDPMSIIVIPTSLI
jgi:hypothetical protein